MSVLQLADAKTHLNITTGTNDAELQTVIDAAEAVIAKRIGPLSPTTVTSRVDGCSDVLILPVLPVISLTSITPVNGTALDLASIAWGLTTAGLVRGQWGFSCYDVTYQAGRTTLPADLLFAVKEMTRHLWMSQRGSTAKPGSDAADVPGYLMPYRVADLIGPYLLPGVA